MIKTQIQLEEWQYDAIKKACSEASRSMSDFVRESVSLLLKKTSSHPMTDLEQIAGKYRSGSVEDLKDHDRVWTESIR